MSGFNKIIALVIITVIMSGFGIRTCAASENYVYDNENNISKAPAAAEYTGFIDGDKLKIGAFVSPQDMLCAGEKMYISDTGNNRIVVFSLKDENNVKIISSFDNEGKRDTFSQPYGIFVDENERLFVADTGNGRIVELDSSFNLINVITVEKMSSLPEDFVFKPTKIALDKYGQMFVISEGYNAGLMEFDATGKFVQSMGAPLVVSSVIEQFWRNFATKAQKSRMQAYVPTEYSNVAVDNAGFIFVTTSAYDAGDYESGQLKPLRKLNAKGNDVLTRIGDPVGDNTKSGITYKGPSAFVDVCSIGNDNFAVLDQKRGRVFVYNSECEMLYEFGGVGLYGGKSVTAVALAFYDDTYYVLDSNKKEIMMYSVTQYGRLFSKIAQARSDIDYSLEKDLWSEIVSRNENCTLAMRGLGNIEYKQMNMKAAMSYFKAADDKANYSKAFSFVRRKWIENNSWLFFGIIVLFVTLLIVYSKNKKRINNVLDSNGFGRAVRYSSYVSFHPLDGFWDLKREKRGSLSAAIALLAACAVTLTLSNLYTGFIFNRNDLETYSIFDVWYVFAAVALWVICQWCVTTLMNGEGKFKDIFISTCYCLKPYIVINLLCIPLSYILLDSEGELYRALIILSVVWMLGLILASVQQTHGFSFGKTMLAILIILVVIMLVLFIGMLVLALSQQLIAFIKDISNELILRL